MRRRSFSPVMGLVIGFVAACGAKHAAGPCELDPPAPECSLPCDPLPGAPNTCPQGYHCSPDGMCTAACTPTGGECGGNAHCSDDGTCIPDDPDVPDAGLNPVSCRLVDLVIAVDGSSSMDEELVAMRNIVFPAFAQRLPMIGMGLDNFRVGTIDACPNPANYHTQGNGGPCNFSSGQVWIDSSSPNLNAEFACVGDIYQGDVGCTGNNDDEQPASAAAASLEPPYSTGANLGFSRSDALLVIVAITDEDEQPTPDRTAQEVYDRIIATKGGDVRRVVFLGIGGSSSCTGVYGQADPATKLHDVTNRFIAANRGVWWDLCAGGLENGLDEAFEIISQACDELPPID
jgi:hypothetical protein